MTKRTLPPGGAAAVQNPYLESGKVVGYTSIRIKPSSDQVKKARTVYEQVLKGDHSWEIKEGQAYKKESPLTAWLPFKKLSLAAKFNILTGGFIAWLISTIALMQISAPWSSFALNTMLGLGALMGLIGLYTFKSASLKTLKDLQHYIHTMSSGDLTELICAQGHKESRDALQALKILQINFKLLVGQIKESSGVVAKEAQCIASGSAEVSSRTEHQASSLEETAASMEEMTSTVKQSAQNAHDANELALDAAQRASLGGKTIDDIAHTMNAIEESSDKIADIIGLIDGIAFQTNILALNAAVEAAQAGEQGRGFAVVATEVRNLAHRSASAAKDIKTLIQTSVSEVKMGTQKVSESKEVMSKVVLSVEKVESFMGDINLATKEQRAGIEQINDAIVSMDEVTQKNAAMIEETAVAASQMQTQALHLRGLIEHFKLVS